MLFINKIAQGKETTLMHSENARKSNLCRANVVQK